MANERQSAPGQNGQALAPDASATDTQVAPERSAATLVSGIIGDAQHLIGLQLAMFRQEFHGEFRKVWQAALVVLASVGVSVVGCVMLLLMLPLLLHFLVAELPLWACFGIVGGVLAAVGGGLAFVGVRRIQSYSPLLSQAAKAFRENFTWTTASK